MVRNIDWLTPSKNNMGKDGFLVEDAMRRYITFHVDGDAFSGLLVLNRVGEELKFALLQYIGDDIDGNGSLGELYFAGTGKHGVVKNIQDIHYGDSRGLIGDPDLGFMNNAFMILKQLFSNGIESKE